MLTLQLGILGCPETQLQQPGQSENGRHWCLDILYPAVTVHCEAPPWLRGGGLVQASSTLLHGRQGLKGTGCLPKGMLCPSLIQTLSSKTMRPAGEASRPPSYTFLCWSLSIMHLVLTFFYICNISEHCLIYPSCNKAWSYHQLVPSTAICQYNDGADLETHWIKT